MHTFGLSGHDGEGPQRCVGGVLWGKSPRRPVVRILVGICKPRVRTDEGGALLRGRFLSHFFLSRSSTAGWWEARTHG